ncbi:rhodanese-like domain-containing protein [Rickettsia endosymbiont of Halotydeus destructor]|uniref:rhodanese-like domain-containing protein n=1 Tax=Rickettsia endosymbiont of Halotydeus destructor TaxID=2996754 RepID=UPI003BAF85EC
MNVKNINSLVAYSLIMADKDAVLIDVRTQEEWKTTGVPCLSDNNKVVFLSWQLAPNMLLNKDFEPQFISSIKNTKSNIFFLCRSGYRSLSAATFIAQVNCENGGYKNCYNIIDGFEGNNRDIGWKQNNLPWQL